MYKSVHNWLITVILIIGFLLYVSVCLNEVICLSLYVLSLHVQTKHINHHAGVTVGTADGKSARLRSHSCCVLVVYFALHNLAISHYTTLQLWKPVFKICNWSLLFIHNSTTIASNPGSTGSLFKTLWTHVAKVPVEMCTVLYNWQYCKLSSVGFCWYTSPAFIG